MKVRSVDTTWQSSTFLHLLNFGVSGATHEIVRPSITGLNCSQRCATIRGSRKVPSPGLMDCHGTQKLSRARQEGPVWLRETDNTRPLRVHFSDPHFPGKDSLWCLLEESTACCASRGDIPLLRNPDTQFTAAWSQAQRKAWKRTLRLFASHSISESGSLNRTDLGKTTPVSPAVQ